MHRVVFVCYPGFQPLDLTGPHEVFAGATEVLAGARRRREAAPASAPGYSLAVSAPDPGVVVGESGLAVLAPHHVAADEPIDTLVVVGGTGAIQASTDAATVALVADLGQRAGRVASVCSGTFLLAAAGLLPGRRVTTHWHRAAQLAATYPNLTVDAAALYVQDGNVWTSAGVTAGIDLALALVETDHGPVVAQLVARHLVMFLRRPGGQSQFAAPVWDAPVDNPGIRAAQDLVRTDPAASLPVARLAAAANMSERHFARVFATAVGEPPAKYVERVRVDLARHHLEHGAEPVAAVAGRCGFGTAETMRRSFVRRLGVAPDAYRDRFAVGSAGAPVAT